MVNPPLDLLEHRSFKDLAAALRRRLGEILTRWQAIVRETLPGAEELTLAQLRDDLPGILAQLADVLEADEPAPTQELLERARPHGEVRFHQHYNVNELLVEYNLLRRIMLEEISADLGRSMTVQEHIALNLGIDTASRRGIVAFVEHQTERLQAATESESKYLSFLAHDLRGNLNGVVLMMEVLRRDLEPHSQFAESLNDLSLMRRSILETVGTMDRLLQAEKLRRGKIPVNFAPVSLESLAADIAAQFAHQAREKGLQLNCQIPSGAIADTDRELLSLVLHNLVGNAIKYTPAGVVKILADLHEGSWSLSVVDNGPGIPPQQLATLFDPFVRGDTHGQVGVGLGLSIARLAADLLAAKLTAESEAGLGATFKLTLKPQK